VDEHAVEAAEMAILEGMLKCNCVAEAEIIEKKN
jgi:hypothetical protein